jgi:hypothetical protein
MAGRRRDNWKMAGRQDKLVSSDHLLRIRARKSEMAGN